MLIPIIDTKAPPPSLLQTFFAMGFRPLYLLGAVWAVVAIALWIFAPQWLQGPLSGVWWHAHEMLWGFIVTIAVGFLLTASATWTGRNPIRSWGLAVLCLCWLGARIGYCLPGLLWWAGALDSVFLLGAALALGRVLIKVKSRHNYPLVFALIVLCGIHIAFIYAASQQRGDWLQQGFQLGLLAMTFIALLIGRRVIPFFAQRGAQLQLDRCERSGRYQLWITPMAFLTLWLGWHAVASVLLLGLGGITLYQLWQWQPWQVRRIPLLWVLYIAYAALGMGLIVAAQYFAPWLTSWPVAAFVHSIGMAGFCVMILGMITRTALGHTGRPLRASRLMTVAFLLLIVASVLRLMAVFFPHEALLHSSALGWCLAFSLYVWEYAPYLCRPRLDGRPG